MPETFRTTKLQRFIKSKCAYMEMQQQVIEQAKKEFGPDVVKQLEAAQKTLYICIAELCQEFSIEMPEIPGCKHLKKG